MSDDIIKKALGMPSIASPDEKLEIVPFENDIESFDTALDQDFDFVVSNLKDLVAQSNEALSELVAIAKQSQHPRAFEVVATLLKVSAEINNDILNAHKKKNDLSPTKASHTKGLNVTNNNLFVGSTAALQDMLEQMKKENE